MNLVTLYMQCKCIHVTFELHRVHLIHLVRACSCYLGVQWRNRNLSGVIKNIFVFVRLAKSFWVWNNMSISKL